MTGSTLRLSEIQDYVDVEQGEAWVEFECDGRKIHWDAQVDNDWMDPYVIVRYDKLLKENRKGVRIYSNHQTTASPGSSALSPMKSSNGFRSHQRRSLPLSKDRRKSQHSTGLRILRHQTGSQHNGMESTSAPENWKLR